MKFGFLISFFFWRKSQSTKGFYTDQNDSGMFDCLLSSRFSASCVGCRDTSSVTRTLTTKEGDAHNEVSEAKSGEKVLIKHYAVEKRVEAK